MAKNSLKIVHWMFGFVCWSSAISITFYWVYLFSLNEDLITLEYPQYYHDESSAYPILSLCFKNPFNISKLEEMKPGIHAEFYLEFLEGKRFSSELWKNDYKNIAFDVSQYVLEYWIEWRNGSTKTYPPTSDVISIFSTTFSGFWRDGFYNCYGVPVMNDVELQRFSVNLKNDVFPSEIRPERYDFFTILHYPNQLLRSTNNIRYLWHKRKTNDSYVMRFVVEGTEIVKRRQNGKRHCNKEWKTHDMVVQKKHSQKIGCRAPYQTQDNELRPCSTAQEMKQARFSLRYDEYEHAPPCKAMEKLCIHTEKFTFQAQNGMTISVFGLDFITEIRTLKKLYK